MGKYFLDIFAAVGSEKIKGNILEKSGEAFGLKMISWGDSGSKAMRWIAGQRVVIGTLSTFGTGLGPDTGTDLLKEHGTKRLPGAEAAERREKQEAAERQRRH